MHRLSFEKLRLYNTGVKVPECYYFIPKGDSEFFDKHRALCEAARDVCHLPTNVLAFERIIPLPQDTRRLLIEKYCAPRIKPQAFSDPANKDCLVRVYLGSPEAGGRGMFFSLRNFKLHLKQMIELQLEVEAMASQMAETLAVMHWAARTDARDVEFVLGSSTMKLPLAAKSYSELIEMEPCSFTGPKSRTHEDFFHRKTELWLLDFNQVRNITMDEEGVAQAVEATSINDPYFPKPFQGGMMARNLWDRFVKRYLSMASDILKDEDSRIQGIARTVYS
ncbi:hypothetical protein K449DRAFT_389287 [Hypoxylon sp. EC38]|nr:hypothetical protein K449DRAFT_389287 [Hypoxylon sp. EC38]